MSTSQGRRMTRRTYSAGERTRIISAARASSAVEAAREFDVPPSTVRTWLRQEETPSRTQPAAPTARPTPTFRMPVMPSRAPARGRSGPGGRHGNGNGKGNGTGRLPRRIAEPAPAAPTPPVTDPTGPPASSPGPTWSAVVSASPSRAEPAVAERPVAEPRPLARPAARRRPTGDPAPMWSDLPATLDTEPMTGLPRVRRIERRQQARRVFRLERRLDSGTRWRALRGRRLELPLPLWLLGLALLGAGALIEAVWLGLPEV